MQGHAFAEQRHYDDPRFPLAVWAGRNLRYTAHWHAEVELVCLDQGSLTVGIDTLRISLAPGDCAVAGSADIHWYEPGPEGCSYRLLIFHPGLAGEPGGWPLRHHLGRHALKGPLAPGISGLVDQILAESRQQAPSWQPLVRGLLLQLTALLDRHLASADPAAPPAALPDLAGRQRMHRALDHIRQHYRTPLGLEDAARVAALSPSHFCRLFPRYTGSTFCHYLTQLRLDAALELLEHSGQSILDIALACGFGSLRSFNRAFLKRYGHPPRSIRHHPDLSGPAGLTSSPPSPG